MKNDFKYIESRRLNKEAYDSCISQSKGSRIYAKSWFLDLVTEHWAVLVYKNYEAVMPLPYRSKWGLKYIYPPCWSQQLGIYARTELSKKLIQTFFKHIPNRFVKVTQYLHSEMSAFQTDNQRINYLLAIPSTKEELLSKWNNNRKRALKKSHSQNLQLDKALSPDDFLTFYNAVPKYKSTTDKCLQALNRLVQSKHPSMHLWGVHSNGELLSALCWMHDANRIYYLIPVSSKEGKSLGAPTYLIHELLKEHLGTNCILDFEGSMDKGVASFYKSFGAYPEYYSVFSSGWLR